MYSFYHQIQFKYTDARYMQEITTHTDRHAEGEINKHLCKQCDRWSAHASSMCAGVSVGVFMGKLLPREPRRSERLNLRL